MKGAKGIQHQVVVLQLHNLGGTDVHGLDALSKDYHELLQLSRGIKAPTDVMRE